LLQLDVVEKLFLRAMVIIKTTMQNCGLCKT